MANTRSKRLGLRLTEAEAAALDSRARAVGLTQSEYVRRFITQTQELPPAYNFDMNALRHIYSEIRKQGTNLNQIAKELNTHHRLNDELEGRLESAFNDIERNSKYLNHLMAQARQGGC